MEFIRFAMLLLVQLSPIFVHVNGEAVYECTTPQNSDVTVTKASALLTTGCVLDGMGINFDLKAMYEAARKTPNNPKTPVVIDISHAAFIDSHIKLINAHSIPDNIEDAGPLLFSISNSNMTGNSRLEFGSEGKVFMTPPNSRIRIIHSKLTISSTDVKYYVFIFYSLRLVTNSSMEIAHNVITMEYKGGRTINVFNLPTDASMKVSDKSSFTVRDNKITMNGTSGMESLYPFVWCQESNSPLTITDSSIYTWASNIIIMVGYGVKLLTQSVWYQHDSSPLTISKASNYTWLMNSISMDIYNIGHMDQYVWFTFSPITISGLSQLLFDSNRILMHARNDGTTTPYLWYVMLIWTISDDITSGAISEGSSMVWRDNCVGMGHKKTDKSHVFGGKWSIRKGSELLLDGNYITTTDEYEQGGSGLTQLVLGPKWDTDITISTGALTIRNTKVYSNSASSGATGSVLWKNSLFTSKTDVKPAMVWSSSPAKDGSGSPIPTLDNSNLRQYMCVDLPNIPSTATVTPTLIAPNPAKADSKATTTAEVKSATAILSTIPGVLITSVVFLFLYNW